MWKIFKKKFIYDKIYITFLRVFEINWALPKNCRFNVNALDIIYGKHWRKIEKLLLWNFASLAFEQNYIVKYSMKNIWLPKIDYSLFPYYRNNYYFIKHNDFSLFLILIRISVVVHIIFSVFVRVRNQNRKMILKINLGKR